MSYAVRGGGRRGRDGGRGVGRWSRRGEKLGDLGVRGKEASLVVARGRRGEEGRRILFGREERRDISVASTLH